MKPKQQEKNKNATYQPTQGHWQQMNRKQRREMTRKIQSEDISLEMIHPDAAGIDIGNESHYVAVPPTRDSQPVGRFGCTTAVMTGKVVVITGGASGIGRAAALAFAREGAGVVIGDIDIAGAENTVATVRELCEGRT